MQLSDYTRKILENFVLINDGIVIKKTPEGETNTRLRIISKTKSVYAEVTVPEVFENTVSLYELPIFLSLLSSLDNPELEFGDSQVELKKHNSVSRLTYASPETITHPKKDFELNQVDLSFELKQADLGKLLEVAKVIKAPNLKLYSKNGKLFFKALDAKNSSSNSYEVEVGSGDTTVEYFFKRELLTLLPGDYNVSVSSNISVFENQTIETLKYIVALETDMND